MTMLQAPPPRVGAATPASKLPQKGVDVNGSKVLIPNFGRCSDRTIVTNGCFDALRRGAAAQA
jgi:hypothetical protein